MNQTTNHKSRILEYPWSRFNVFSWAKRERRQRGIWHASTNNLLPEIAFLFSFFFTLYNKGSCYPDHPRRVNYRAMAAHLHKYAKIN